jgi:hypothetical protein
VPRNSRLAALAACAVASACDAAASGLLSPDASSAVVGEAGALADGGGRVPPPADGATSDAGAPALDAGDATPYPSIDAAPASRTVAAWEQLFLGVWDTEWPAYEADSKSTDSFDFYNGTYYLDGLVSMIEATGKQTYADRAFVMVANMVASARPSNQLGGRAFGDDFLGWTSSKNGSNAEEVPLYESYMWRHVTALLRAVHDQPSLLAAKRADYDAALAFTEKNMFDKWVSRGVDAYVYRSRTHMASHWARIALDLTRLTSDAARATRAQGIVDAIDHGGMANNGGASLRSQLRPGPTDPRASFWSDVWGQTARPGQDVAHGNAVIGYAVEANRLGYAWTRDDMLALTATLNVVWHGAGSYGDFVDGTGSGTGWFSDGWDKLGRFDGAVQARLEAHGVGIDAQFYGAGAANAAALGLR